GPADSPLLPRLSLSCPLAPCRPLLMPACPSHSCPSHRQPPRWQRPMCLLLSTHRWQLRLKPNQVRPKSASRPDLSLATGTWSPAVSPRLVKRRGPFWPVSPPPNLLRPIRTARVKTAPTPPM